MKKSVMKKWVAALRSEKYKQIRGILKNNDGFCCLGVLCDISKKSRWKYYNQTYFGEFYSKEYQYLSHSDALPNEVINWAGMKSPTGFLVKKGKNYGKDLAHFNDTRKFSFKSIANLIEKNWKNL